jgi:hypothetical protein
VPSVPLPPQTLALAGLAVALCVGADASPATPLAPQLPGEVRLSTAVSTLFFSFATMPFLPEVIIFQQCN